MKLLLDENLRRKLKYRFDAAFEVITVPEIGWVGFKKLLPKVWKRLSQKLEPEEMMAECGLAYRVLKPLDK